jgi:phage terminase small subunit
MARSAGRKPLPTYLKVVKNVKKNRINRAEAVLPPALPMPPEHLMDEAKVEWGRVAHDLYEAGLLTKIDRAALAGYCQIYARWTPPL